MARLKSDMAELRERFDDQTVSAELRDESRQVAREGERRGIAARLKALGARVTDLEGGWGNGPPIDRLDEHERAILQIIPRLARVERVLAALGDEE